MVIVFEKVLLAMLSSDEESSTEVSSEEESSDEESSDEDPSEELSSDEVFSSDEESEGIVADVVSLPSSSMVIMSSPMHPEKNMTIGKRTKYNFFMIHISLRYNKVAKKHNQNLRQREELSANRRYFSTKPAEEDSFPAFTFSAGT